MTQLPYASSDQLKSVLDKTSGADDDVLGLALAGATAFINRECRRRFDSQTLTRTFTTSDVGRLVTPDLVSVTSLSRAAGTGQTPVVIASGSYFLGPDPVEDGWPYQWIDLSDVGTYPTFTTGFRTVTVVGVWGWERVPDDIVQVCISLAARFWKATKAGFNDTIGVDATGEVQFTKYMSTYDGKVLAHYRRRRGFV